MSFGNLSGFDAEKVEPLSFRPFEAIPSGTYKAVIEASELLPTRNNPENKYLKLKFRVLEGEYEGRLVWAQLNIHNTNAQAAEIARGELSAICRAIGVLKPTDSSQLHKKPLSIVVGQRTWNDKTVNEVKGYASYSSTPPTPPTPPTPLTPLTPLSKAIVGNDEDIPF